MEITIKTAQNATLVDLAGDVDANSAPTIEEKIRLLARPGNKILMNMSKVLYLSSAGLRMLLSLYRQTVAQDGQLVLVGLSEDIQDTMAVTGFLDFFTTRPSLEAGLEALK